MALKPVHDLQALLVAFFGHFERTLRAPLEIDRTRGFSINYVLPAGDRRFEMLRAEAGRPWPGSPCRSFKHFVETNPPGKHALRGPRPILSRVLLSKSPQRA